MEKFVGRDPAGNMLVVPEVLAVGRFGPSGDAAIVSMLPSGAAALSDVDPAAVADSTLDELLGSVLRLRSAGIAHDVSRCKGRLR